MIKDLQTSAAALYDGGWRASDKEELIAEYDLTADEATKLCEELAKIASKKVILSGKEYDWDVIVGCMDDEVREAVHFELAPCTEPEFLTRYCTLHEEKFGEKFEIN